MQRLLLFVLLWVFGVACSKEDLALNGQSAKARVLYPSCAGTVLQWVDRGPTGNGQQWLWFTDLKGPFDKDNPAKTYPNCVSAFDVSSDRQVIGDTLEFTYKELSGPLGDVCALGGLPTVYVSVKALKSR